jgi:hypothetical protein
MAAARGLRAVVRQVSELKGGKRRKWNRIEFNCGMEDSREIEKVD